MNPPRSLCSLRFFHDWYGLNPAPFRVIFVGDSAKFVRQQQLTIKLLNGVYEVFWIGEDLDELPDDLQLEFEVYSTDPWLVAHTDFGSAENVAPLPVDVLKDAEEDTLHRTAEYIAAEKEKAKGKGTFRTADIVLRPDTPDRAVMHSDWKKTDQYGAPLARLKVFSPRDETPTPFTLRFSSISTHWIYIVDGPHLPDTLAVIGKDGSQQFAEIESSPAANGRIPRRFRSIAARQSRRNDSSWFQLVPDSTGSGSLISPLPTPGPHVLPRPIPNSSLFVSQIFVTVLAKGGP